MIEEQLQAIYDETGRLTPADVVEAARPKGHPLHTVVFNKTRGDAAEAYYLERAAELIRKVRITYKHEEGEPPRSVRGWVSLPGEDGQSYQPARKVAEDPIARRVVLAQMEREWKTLKDRYGEFDEFAAMVLADAELLAK